jgi:hypothetical protein
MKRLALFILSVALMGATQATAADLAPGAIYVHTARDGTTLTASDKPGQPSALKPKIIFNATGQVVEAPNGLAMAMVLSNGNALYLPNGGRLTFDEFTQEPVTNTGRDRDYEPTRSNLRLNLAEGLLVISGRNPVPTSTFTLTTPLVQINCHSQSLVVEADADGVTITVLDGTAEVAMPGTAVHETVQSGQTATISRHNLHDAYPLKLTSTTTDASEHLAVFMASAHRIESETTFIGTRQHFQVSLSIPLDHTLQISADDPRFL